MTKTYSGTLRAVALATLLTITLVAGTPIPPSSAAISGICHDTDNENGFGGTHVYCDFSCAANAGLSVSAVAHDDEATVEGKVTCGGTKAYCDYSTQLCEGTSATEQPPVTSSSEDGSDNCWARSHEWIDSAVTVECSSLGADPAEVCRLVPNLPVCEGSSGIPPDDPCPLALVMDCGTSFGITASEAYELCALSNPAMPAPLGQLLLELPEKNLLSFVVAYVDGGSGAWASLVDGECTAGAIA